MRRQALRIGVMLIAGSMPAGGAHASDWVGGTCVGDGCLRGPHAGVYRTIDDDDDDGDDLRPRMRHDERRSYRSDRRHDRDDRFRDRDDGADRGLDRDDDDED